MDRKVAVVVLAVVFCLAGIIGISYAADQKAPAAAKAMAPKVPAIPQRPANIGMFGGTIEKIDNADPANVKIQIKDDATGTSRTVAIAPWTNVTKVTDISELKTGEAVRVMVRKVEDKEVAMGVLFGKIKNLPPMRTTPRPAAPAQAPQLPAKKAGK